jgi:hypothetical protein
MQHVRHTQISQSRQHGDIMPQPAGPRARNNLMLPPKPDTFSHLDG